MSERHRRLQQERRLRRVAITAAARQHRQPDAVSGLAGTGEPVADSGEAGEEVAGEAASEEPDDDSVRDRRADQQALWVDLQVRAAMRRGDFDDLPGAGKPIRGLGSTHDPDWWVKGLIERERLTGIAPPAIELRRENAELDERLDRETTEQGVRRVLGEFNERVVEARRQLQGGPPVITATRDPEATLAAWRQRREERRRQARRARAGTTPSTRSASTAGRTSRRWRWLRLRRT